MKTPLEYILKTMLSDCAAVMEWEMQLETFLSSWIKHGLYFQKAEHEKKLLETRTDIMEMVCI